jgi:hypothetical protein
MQTLCYVASTLLCDITAPHERSAWKAGWHARNICTVTAQRAQSATLRVIAAADLTAADTIRGTTSFAILYPIDSFTLVANTRGW